VKQFFRDYGSGFVITLDSSLYARPAVMKALYRMQAKYTIAYERRGKWLYVNFTPSSKTTIDVVSEAAEALRSIQFEMLRYDTMRQTAHVRELLIGRALYATCVETERADKAVEIDGGASWKDDAERILESWNG
jgi:His-Xaa-Ser system protein HxsD